MNDTLGLFNKSAEIRRAIADFETSLSDKYKVVVKLSFLPVEKLMLIDAVAKLVSDVLAIPMNALIGPSRKTEIVNARHIAVYLCLTKIEEVSLKEVAEYFGGRDHTTAINSRNEVIDKLSVNDALITENYNACLAAFAEKTKP